MTYCAQGRIKKTSLPVAEIVHPSNQRLRDGDAGLVRVARVTDVVCGKQFAYSPVSTFDCAEQSACNTLASYLYKGGLVRRYFTLK